MFLSHRWNVIWIQGFNPFQMCFFWFAVRKERGGSPPAFRLSLTMRLHPLPPDLPDRHRYVKRFRKSTERRSLPLPLDGHVAPPVSDPKSQNPLLRSQLLLPPSTAKPQSRRPEFCALKTLTPLMPPENLRPPPTALRAEPESHGGSFGRLLNSHQVCLHKTLWGWIRISQNVNLRSVLFLRSSWSQLSSEQRASEWPHESSDYGSSKKGAGQTPIRRTNKDRGRASPLTPTLRQKERKENQERTGGPTEKFLPRGGACSVYRWWGRGFFNSPGQ